MDPLLVIVLGVLLLAFLGTGGKFAAGLHGLVFGLVVKLLAAVLKLLGWLLGKFIEVPVVAVTRFGTAVWAWMNLMFRVWVSVLVGGILVLVGARITVKLSPPGSLWRVAALLACLLWLAVAFSAARFTMEYLSIRRVRQRGEFVQLSERVKNIEGQVFKGLPALLARRTRDHPLGQVFPSNRDAQARRAAEEHQREVAAAEREELVVAMNTEHNPYSD